MSKPTREQLAAAVAAQAPTRTPEPIPRVPAPVELRAEEAAPYYARRNASGMYTWEGRQYPSVTTILSAAPGQNLMPWYAKQAALKAASHLVHAGVPANDDALKQFVSELQPRDLTLDEAIHEVLNWQTVMREAERYRDHKARIGSVVHHALYERALGLAVEADRDYLRAVAISLSAGLWTDVPAESQVVALADAALPYVISAFDWIERTSPDWVAIGQEAVVVKPGELGYAGTVDWSAKFRKASYRDPWPWGDRNEVLVTGDFKTSNALSKSVQLQLEAYANAEFIGLVGDGSAYPVPEAEAIAALHIGPDAGSLGIETEFGLLETKAKQIGAKLYTWPRSKSTFRAFEGLLHYWYWQQSPPKADQTRARTAAPKTPPMREAARPAPF